MTVSNPAFILKNFPQKQNETWGLIPHSSSSTEKQNFLYFLNIDQVRNGIISFLCKPLSVLSVSYGGIGEQWQAVQTGVLAAADLGHAACGISSLGRRSPLDPP